MNFEVSNVSISGFSNKEATMADEFRADLYDVLGLEPGAEEKEVARAYKKKSLKHHPDRGGDGARRSEPQDWLSDEGSNRVCGF